MTSRRRPPGSEADRVAIRLSIRMYLPSGMRVGRGKIALLEAVGQTGSISAAARQIKMSYKRAWDLIDEMNRNFTQRVVVTAAHGGYGGGATLSAFATDLIERYRCFERGAYDAGHEHLRAIEQLDNRSGAPGTGDSGPPRGGRRRTSKVVAGAAQCSTPAETDRAD